MLSAARRAPSAYNQQPWRFLYAHRAERALFEAFMQPLIPFNKAWAGKASVLLYLLSNKDVVDESGTRPSHSHSFDAGASWAFLALQASSMGYVAHAMTGVDFEAATEMLQVPTSYKIEAAIAIGRMGDKSQLPEMLQQREAPGSRKNLDEIARGGTFPADW